MRKFIAGFCCVVVGLQVLIGVPLAVCFTFFALTQGGGPVAFEGNTFPGPYPSTIPPPNFPGVQPYSAAALSLPMPSSNPATLLPPSASPQQTVDPPTISPSEPAVSAILECREQIGSPLAGTLLAPPADTSLADFAPTLRQVAAADEQAPVGGPATPAVEPAPEQALLATLTQATERLYELAGRFENDGHFQRADRIRSLARELRSELSALKEEQRSRQPEPTVAPGVDGVGSPPSSNTSG